MAGRRSVLHFLSSLPILGAMPIWATSSQSSALIQRKIPRDPTSIIPAVGMGSYQTFNVEHDVIQKNNLLEVLKTFFSLGGQFIDSSPMYGHSEAVIGELIRTISPRPKWFAASKVWTYGKQSGFDSINHSASLMGKMRADKATMDLMQIHNLRDWQIHLPTLMELKQRQIIRYIGITTSRISQYSDFEKVMRQHQLDFIQLNYNIKVRDAEERLLPLALERKMGVIVNMPYEKGRLFKLVKNKPLPTWAKEIDCHSWGQFFLKYIISHPAVTCVIPATSKVHHMRDNMQAMYGRLPDDNMRQKMVRYFNDL
ncbi:aldo/keto reductase [Aliikangiella maris]|uniref:Aldo/keto reductase n=2 Tax=Aliikangiella maris TaxID=3162458 RepID=A0ABV2BZJ1_9GAMM